MCVIARAIRAGFFTPLRAIVIFCVFATLGEGGLFEKVSMGAIAVVVCWFLLVIFVCLHRWLRTFGMIVVIPGLFFAVFSARAKDEPSLSALIPPETRAEYVTKKIAEADVLCEALSLRVTTETDRAFPPSSNDRLPGKNGERITERPVALCAYSEANKTWHIIDLHLQYPVPIEYRNCVKNAETLSARGTCKLPFHVVTPGYEVEHIHGTGVSRLIFNVYEQREGKHGDEPFVTRGEKLTVYRTRHVWFDDDALLSGDTERIIATARAVNYTPYHPDFRDPSLVSMGIGTYVDSIVDARRELRKRNVRSLAYPQKRLADVVVFEIPFALGLIEQMDDLTFEEDNGGTIESVFVEYALNGKNAFRFAQSNKDAIGPLQFTNTNGSGTYAWVVQSCGTRGAKLDPDFDAGARDLHNVTMAEHCLIDMELAQFPEILKLYRKKPLLGGLYPVAAYNGGHNSARALYADIRSGRLALSGFKGRDSCPCHITEGKRISGAEKKKGKPTPLVLNSETRGYVKKYVAILNYIVEEDIVLRYVK